MNFIVYAHKCTANLIILYHNRPIKRDSVFVVYFTMMITVLLRSIAGIAFFILTMIFGGGIAYVRTLFGTSPEIAFTEIGEFFSRRMLYICGINLKVTGIENLNFAGRKVIVANHQGAFDIPILIVALGIRFKFLVKKELFDAPLFGWFAKNMGQIPIDRASTKKAYKMLKVAIKSIENGQPLAVFPEGTRSLTGELGVFKKGSLFVAVSAKAKIIPVSINGSYKIQRKGSLLINPSDVTVNIGKAIDIDLDQDNIMDRSDELNDEVRGRIIKLLAKN